MKSNNSNEKLDIYRAGLVLCVYYRGSKTFESYVTVPVLWDEVGVNPCRPNFARFHYFSGHSRKLKD